MVNLAIQNQGQWERFCRVVLERPELIEDERFRTNERRLHNRTELEPLIEAILGELTSEQVIARLERADVPFGNLNRVVDLVAHPQLVERNRIREVDSPAGPVAAFLPPFNIEGLEPRMGAVPDVGQHSDEVLAELGFATAVVLPLPAEGRTVGVLTVYLDPGRSVGEHDLAIAREVAGHAGRAIDRVRRQSQQAKLAEALQRSLLTDPPTIPGVSVVVRYVPAAEAARVGGDWYDAFLQRDGAPVIVIGDVVGHDTAAAAAMGQLRSLLRGIAHHSGAGPAEVLRGLDEAMAHMHDETLATAAVARLERTGDRGWTRLRWANAGHPPPLLLAANGEVSVLGEPVGDLMLGVDCGVHREERETAVGPGDTVLLYTDGLVERRDSVFDAGLDRLVEQLRALADRPLDEMCDALLDRLLQGTPQDDVALVAVRLTAEQ
jgi:serine phosphatase RsbU (regulator of sigma subunit)